MVFYLLRPPSPRSTLFPYTTLFRSHRSRRRILREAQALSKRGLLHRPHLSIDGFPDDHVSRALRDSPHFRLRSEEHTSELQSPVHLVCRLLLEKTQAPWMLPTCRLR